jgi:hypothetical protein
VTSARSRRGNAELRDDADVSGDPLTAATRDTATWPAGNVKGKKPHSRARILRGTSRCTLRRRRNNSHMGTATSAVTRAAAGATGRWVAGEEATAERDSSSGGVTTAASPRASHRRGRRRWERARPGAFCKSLNSPNRQDQGVHFCPVWWLCWGLGGSFGAADCRRDGPCALANIFFTMSFMCCNEHNMVEVRDAANQWSGSLLFTLRPRLALLRGSAGD